jgi:hypothetical protein
MRHLFTVCFIFLALTNVLFGQEEEKIFVVQKETNWEEFSEKIQEKNNIRFYYNTDSIPNITFSIKKDSINLLSFLNARFLKNGVKVSKDRYGNYFLFKGYTLNTDLSEVFNKLYVQNKRDRDDSETSSGTNGDFIKTYQDFISDNVTIGTSGKTTSKLVKFTGYVTNASDGDIIPQARIKIVELNMNIVTNYSGFYELTLKPGTYTVEVNSLGMHEKKFKLNLLSNGKLDIPLKTKSFMLNEAVVSANYHHNVRSTTMGFEKITAKSIKQLPVVLGEPDIVKVALLLPGVQTVGEASAGFNVRGSPADQNLFYINDLPIYNSSHIFGLFTTFNSDAISEFNFYKSNIPIEHGGQLSSIFEIDTKNGNKEHFSARGGVGPTAARIMAEGPIKKDSSSYLISVRSTYSDWILNQVNNLDIQNSSASFNDALMNFSFQLNEKNSIGLFLYGSGDKSDLAFGIKNTYTNLGGSFQWSHHFNKKITSDLSIIHSQYAYSEENYEVPYLANKHNFDLNHSELKLIFHYYPNSNHTIQFGLNSKYYDLNYGDLQPLNNESIIKPIEFEGENALSNSLFLGEKWDITNRLTVEGGVRFTLYSYLGSKTVYDYAENAPREVYNIVDSTTYGSGDFIQNYNSFDFRVAGKYEISKTLSVKASYNKLHQYIFMLSNTVSVSPTSKWKLSDPHLKPMVGEQYSFGLYKNWLNDKYETSIEVYQKNVENLVEYKDGSNFITNRLPETNIIQGDLNAYGIEFMIKKKTGKLNGWFNYTYSKSEVTAVNKETGEMNNKGFAYDANYDKPHAFNLTLNYKASKRISISANVVYSTGRPVTYPTSIYYQNGIEIIGFSKRNEYRIPDYFRTDLSINIEGDLKKKKFVHGSWSFSVYNLTGRKNPYSIVFQNEDGKIKGYEISILGTIIPSINYNIKFGNFND